MKQMKLAMIMALGLVMWLGASMVGATTIQIINNDGAGEGLNSNAAPFSGQTGNSGTTLGQQRLRVFQAAASHWEAKIVSSVIIRVGANMDSLSCNSAGGVLGSAGPNRVYGNFANAPLNNTWYVEAVANSRAGVDLSVADDISATFNSSIDNNNTCLNGVNWWLGIGAAAPANTISLFETVLHEIGHGLGFLSLVSQAGAKEQGFNDAYMVNLYDETTSKYWSSMSNAERAVSAVNMGNLVWRGNSVDADSSHVLAGKTNGHLRMYAPNPYQGGSSVSHWDTAISPDELMEPLATPTSNDCSTVRLLKDVGWNAHTGVGQISFSSAQYSAFEDNLSKTISVARTNGSCGAVSVTVNSASGTASGSGVDYNDIVNLTLSWAEGESGSKTFQLGVIDDGLEEIGGETVNLSLSGVSGGATLGTSSATLTINDPDEDFLLLMLPAIISGANN